MDFLKKHYEKVLLGVVLLGLAVAVAFLPFKIASEKQKLEDMRNQLIHPKVKELTNLNLTLPDTVLKRMAAPAAVSAAYQSREARAAGTRALSGETPLMAANGSTPARSPGTNRLRNMPSPPKRSK